MAGVVLLSRSSRPCESVHGHAWTFSEQMIASIIDDSRCRMSDNAFRTVPPIGGLSRFVIMLCCNIVISCSVNLVHSGLFWKDNETLLAGVYGCDNYKRVRKTSIYHNVYAIASRTVMPFIHSVQIERANGYVDRWKRLVPGADTGIGL